MRHHDNPKERGHRRCEGQLLLNRSFSEPVGISCISAVDSQLGNTYGTTSGPLLLWSLHSSATRNNTDMLHMMHRACSCRVLCRAPAGAVGRILLLTARGDKDGMSLLLLALGAAGAQLMWTVTMSLTQRYNCLLYTSDAADE